MSRYARAMEYDAMTLTSDDAVGAILRQELARGDVALAGVAPVLTHLLAGVGQSLVSDAIVAHMRGMLNAVARQLLEALAEADEDTGMPAVDRIDALSGRLVGSTVVLSHVYALAVEAQFAGELEQRAGIDPVLSPLMQELIASENDRTAELAMATMAAQARFMQAQRRMDLPLKELPSDLFHQVLATWRRFSSDCPPDVLSRAEAMLRAQHDEAASRLGLLTRLISAMKGAVHAALSIDHAGIALFASALASQTRQPRELAILSCHEGQVARLALTLKGAGVKTAEIVRQVMLIHPEIALPEGFDTLSQREALSLLGSARGGAKGVRKA